MKHALERVLRGSRGSPAYPSQITSILAKLDEREAEALYRLIQNKEEDARGEGRRHQARTPWRKP